MRAEAGADGVRAVLCDADGNLFPSEEPAFVASAEVTNRFLASFGVTRRYEPEELRLATTGLNFRSTALALATANGVPVARELAPTPPDAPSDDRPVLRAEVLESWVREEKRAVIAYLQRVLSVDPDVLDPLTRLAASYRLAAVSSSADSRIAACFEVTGLAHFFPPDRRFSAEDSLERPTSKPDPAIYRFACESLGLRPDEAVAVEDSVPGATSAVAAGVTTIGNLQFVAPPEREARAQAFADLGVAAVVHSWAEVPDVLTRLGTPPLDVASVAH